jgi:serine/threonine protein kinase
MDGDITRLPGNLSDKVSHLLTIGQEFGQYKVLDLVGRGGMGEVYAVRHSVIDTLHALKLIRPEILERSEAPQRFRREAQVMAKLRHENIIQVDDFGITNGLTWFRMELLPGGAFEFGKGSSLDDVLQSSGPIPEGHVKRMLTEVLKGLSYAHGMGVVHRDLKPANLLISDSGHIKIADFGLVRLAGADWLQSQVQITVAQSMADLDVTRLDDSAEGRAGSETRALLGTFEYMSPEQKRGEEADCRSDLDSIGLIAYRMLTGETTMGFELPSELVEGLDPDWDIWIRKAVATRLERRFTDAIEMLESIPGNEKVEPAVVTKEFARKATPAASVKTTDKAFNPKGMDSRARAKAMFAFMHLDASHAYLSGDEKQKKFESWLISNCSDTDRVVREQKAGPPEPTPAGIQLQAERLAKAKDQVGGTLWKELHQSDPAIEYMTMTDRIRLLADRMAQE